MGKLIVPRHTADLDYIIPALKIYYDSKDWVDTATYKDALVASLIESGKESIRNSDETHYTKCSEIPRYFGFLERAEPGKASSDVRITPSGIAFYEAYEKNDITTIQGIIVEALEKVVFGRNNEGCGSDVDCEAPNIVVVSALLLDGITNKEAAYILSQFLDEKNYSEILLSVKYNRVYGDKLAEPTVTTDIKFIPFFKRIGFMDDAGGGKSVVNKNVINKFRNRLEKLPLTNSDTADGLHEDESENYENEYNLQVIYYGAPGTGKSNAVKKQTGELLDNDEERDLPNVFRTTFHPDTDYASFVGCYKPTMKPTSKEEKTLTGKDEEIVYEFVPQAFTDAYVYAYNNPTEQTYLVIEEINRGNCAQIFGDLFQLLDRKGGVSEYKIKADKDLAQYLRDKLGADSEGIQDGKLCLPANLHILATMNTSDQSLFPMDSAFKRRWEWEYVPINYDTTIKSGEFEITIGKETNERKYSWVGFIEKVNEKIFDLTQSEDKQMGNFFIKQSIDEKGFKSKVMFYLWYEVLRDETENNKYFFYKKTIVDGKEVSSKFTFKDLFGDKATETLQQFMEYLEVVPK